MSILVTGGAGFIGSVMVNRLIIDGYSVVVVDNLERGDKKYVDSKAKLIVGDLLDNDFLSKVFDDNKFDAIVHFAGYISMGESMEDPSLYFKENVVGGLNLISLAARNGVKSFIFSSTAGVYGNPQSTLIKEDYPKNPTNPYGESKLIFEQMLKWYSRIYNLSFVSLRYFNASGALPDSSLGENHSPETHIIPNAIFSALNNSEFVLYGDDYDTADGTCVRDYIHVLDLVDAHILALDKLQKEKGEFYYNVGTGIGHSNKEVVDMVKRISGIDFPIKIEKRRPGDANELIADPTKIKIELGFNPKLSNLETIIKTAWDWHNKNKGSK